MNRANRPYSLILAVSCLALLFFNCKREERGFRVEPPAADKLRTNSVTELYPGGAKPPTPAANSYENNAFAVNEGQKLFSSFNCTGCHFHGGGGIGPALMDNKWIYGSEPNQIFASIVEGRPNGMPSFRAKIPDYQVWQLVAYVRTLGGLGNPNAAPGRNDELSSGQPPNSGAKQTPQNSSLPKSAERPP